MELISSLILIASFLAASANFSAGRFISQDSYRGEVNDPGQWHLYVYCANNPINYTDPSGHFIIGYGWKAEAALAVGGYGALCVCHDKTHIAVTLSAGLKIATNALLGGSFYAFTYLSGKVSDLAGWGLTTGLAFNAIISLNVGVSCSLSSKGKATLTGSAGISASSILKIPYWDTEFGYTWIEKKWKRNSISKTEKTSTVAGYKIKRKRFNSYVRIRIPSKRKQIKVYETKSIISNY